MKLLRSLAWHVRMEQKQMTWAERFACGLLHMLHNRRADAYRTRIYRNYTFGDV